MKPGGSVMVSSSPCREKLPAPPGLARLLSGTGGASLHRGRSTSSSSARSSPMFVSRSRSLGRSSSAAASAATEEGEPSSPKVTCIGQVRMRNKRSAKPKKPVSSKKARRKSSLMPCRCLHKVLLCSLFSARKRPTDGGSDGGGWRSLWRRWLRMRSCMTGRYRQRKPDPVRPSPPTEFAEGEKVTTREEDGDNKNEEEEEEEAREETRVVVSSVTAMSPPPKNALLLMRWSAPHNRASSLSTARFPVPPLPEPASPEDVGEGTTQNEEQQQEERRRPHGGGALLVQEEAGAGAEEDEDGEARGPELQRPLVLRRSKSEPARSAATKLAVPEESYCFWTSNSGSARPHTDT